MLKVFVVPGLWVAAIRGIFLEAGYDLTTKLDLADLVVWTGGADIEPSLYGERPLPTTYCDPGRDKYEVGVFNDLPKTDGPMKVGICRGAQLLCALSGGSLWQDIEGHGRSHEVMDVGTGELVTVSSMHHQEMIPPTGSVVWAKAAEAAHKTKIEKGVKYTNTNGLKVFQDVEAVWIPQTSSFCFQPHPEIGPRSCTEYFFKLVDKALIARAGTKLEAKTTMVSGLTDHFDKTLSTSDRRNIEHAES